MKHANPLRALMPPLALLSHPLNKHRKATAFRRWLAWKIAGNLVPGPVIFKFVNDAMLIVEPGLNGATCNLYTGIYEFEDMSFALHLLREEDLFVDVGANIGSYTVLAAAVGGANSISIEPVPSAFAHLMRNINLNGVRAKVDARNLAVGSKAGSIKFTSAQDSVNHVVAEDEMWEDGVIEVEVRTLDEIVGQSHPTLIKIDVEGYEPEVIAGAADTLAQDSLLAVIVELNGSCRRYGYDEAEVHRKMVDYGFAPFTYSPFDRELKPLHGKSVLGDNTLYIRHAESIRERLRTASGFHVNGYEI
jgi:FkbM family methyltransferase